MPLFSLLSPSLFSNTHVSYTHLCVLGRNLIKHNEAWLRTLHTAACRAPGPSHAAARVILACGGCACSRTYNDPTLQLGGVEGRGCQVRTESYEIERAL